MWKERPELARRKSRTVMRVPILVQTINHEAFSPPVYYALAGLWYDFGRLLGFKGGSAIYWNRFLNLLLYPPVVVLSYFFIRRFYPGQVASSTMRPHPGGVFPQDVFYAINSDVPSPLFFLGALFLAILDWRDRNCSAWAEGAAAGCYDRPDFSGEVLEPRDHRALRGGLGAEEDCVWLELGGYAGARLGEMLMTAGAAAAPVVAWFWRNQHVLGDLTGSRAKMDILTWTAKPFSELGHHPIFMPSGFGYFWGQAVPRSGEEKRSGTSSRFRLSLRELSIHLSCLSPWCWQRRSTLVLDWRKSRLEFGAERLSASRPGDLLRLLDDSLPAFRFWQLLQPFTGTAIHGYRTTHHRGAGSVLDTPCSRLGIRAIQAVPQWRPRVGERPRGDSAHELDLLDNSFPDCAA